MDNALYYVAGEYDKVKSIRNGVNRLSHFPASFRWAANFSFSTLLSVLFCDFIGQIFSPTSRPVDSQYSRVRVRSPARARA